MREEITWTICVVAVVCGFPGVFYGQVLCCAARYLYTESSFLLMPENAPGSVKASGLFIYAENHRDRENLRSPKIALLRWGGRNIDPDRTCKQNLFRKIRNRPRVGRREYPCGKGWYLRYHRVFRSRKVHTDPPGKRSWDGGQRKSHCLWKGAFHIEEAGTSGAEKKDRNGFHINVQSYSLRSRCHLNGFLIIQIFDIPDFNV